MRFLILGPCVVALVAGCATSRQQPYRVVVDSLASSAAKEHRTYVLLPGNEGVTGDDLQFQEYAQYITRVLHLRGFQLAEKAEDADMVIVFSYGVGDPQTQHYSYSLPVWGQTGVSSAYTYGTATVYGNTATYSGTTTYTPTYGITGYRTRAGSVITYLRYALITAYDFEKFRESNKQVQLWRTTITSRGMSGDLRQALPVLMGAAVPYLATNTEKQVQVDLYESDDAVKAVKGTLPEEQEKP